MTRSFPLRSFSQSPRVGFPRTPFQCASVDFRKGDLKRRNVPRVQGSKPQNTTFALYLVRQHAALFVLFGSLFVSFPRLASPCLASRFRHHPSRKAPGVVARLKALGASVDGLLSQEEIAVLDALPATMAAQKTSPVTPGSFRLMKKIVTKESGWPQK